MVIYSGFSHWKWWFSIVMLVYQRVIYPYMPHYLSVLLIFYVFSRNIPRSWLFTGVPGVNAHIDVENPHGFAFRTWSTVHSGCSSSTLVYLEDTFYKIWDCVFVTIVHVFPLRLHDWYHAICFHYSGTLCKFQWPLIYQFWLSMDHSIVVVTLIIMHSYQCKTH